jgi:glycosylphosphatidylinositol transamidase
MDYSVLESTFRSMNNLSEKLHASYFFYILISPRYFIFMTMYLPSVGLINASLLFSALYLWLQTEASFANSTLAQKIGLTNLVNRTKKELLDKCISDHSIVDRPVLPCLLRLIKMIALGSSALFFEVRDGFPCF